MLETLKQRFFAHPNRHPALQWPQVEKRLLENPAALETLRQMEATGGEPDVIGVDKDGPALLFCDCCAETPAGRRSLCYDDDALKSRKKNPPAGSAAAQAQEIGAKLLTEALYRRLQSVEPVDQKTSSWIATPDAIRAKGGALFCERRFDTVFTFHNGADSYYGVRGWRGYLSV